MTENLTACADCGGDLETIDSVSSDGDVARALERECTDCGSTVVVSVLNYPDFDHDVIGPALDDDECTECGSSALIRSERFSGRTRYLCADHVGLHRERVLSLRGEL